jgi:hypothetical protein
LSDKTVVAVQNVVNELIRESGPSSTRKNLPKKELISRFMEKYQVDESFASRAVEQWSRAKNKRS